MDSRCRDFSCPGPLTGTRVPYPEQGRADASWELSLEGAREESSAADAPVEHSLGLRFSLLF
ncbi:MAG: hypothetical protein F4X84_07490 [Synechococcus sp. SB0662_bin_45]|uniref:Uncharacterized protein n=1 Tax=Synechococcus sp. SB0676_bin_10 TaxID=2604869 RepID=A0A6B1FF08_9SYNE|nr:hypothetical protein [Cyanobacteria bacterium MAG IRC3_bin_20]MCY3653939.1 hypothetical protein [Cyanobacteria bacterium MAG IRC1_bin_28]MXW12423.1 hypothetical protein [Synechococcus sp. SB0668_bin_13]MYE22171.1 hypothetical protein [Synechococcus sp. SB0662_bin_45]MYG38832.1 hypothetical protein [Synechococcus sp. SB0676_bin_10]MYK07190.1 hypothetical protein [Synechococcus sp. SB0670_bin_20]